MGKNRHRDPNRRTVPAGSPGSGVPSLAQAAVLQATERPYEHRTGSFGSGGGGVVIDEKRVVPPIVNDPELDAVRSSYDRTREQYHDDLPDVRRTKATFVGPLALLDEVPGVGSTVMLAAGPNEFAGLTAAMGLGRSGLHVVPDEEVPAVANELVAATQAVDAAHTAEQAVKQLAEDEPEPPKPKHGRYWWMRKAGYYLMWGVGQAFLGLFFVARFVFGSVLVALSAVIAVFQGAPSVSNLGFDSQRRRAGRVARDLCEALRTSSPSPWLISWLTTPLAWVLRYPGMGAAELKLPWNRWYVGKVEDRDLIDDEEYLRPHEPINWGCIVRFFGSRAEGFNKWTDKVYPGFDKWFGVLGAGGAYYGSRFVVTFALALVYVLVVAAVCVALVVGYSFLLINVFLSLFVALIDIVRVVVAMGGVHAAPQRTRKVLRWSTEHLPWDSRYYTYGRYRVYVPLTTTLMFEVSE